MTDATAKFFDALVERGHEPLLEKATGTVRFDLKDGRKTDRWLVTVAKGDIKVSRRNLRADCVTTAGYIHRFDVKLKLLGDLTPEQRTALLAIARRCPVYKTLTSEIRIEESLA